eukprot:SAG22_NODE_99_length_20560_cov_128.669029_23_plen_1058_part_00
MARRASSRGAYAEDAEERREDEEVVGVLVVDQVPLSYLSYVELKIQTRRSSDWVIFHGLQPCTQYDEARTRARGGAMAAAAGAARMAPAAAAGQEPAAPGAAIDSAAAGAAGACADHLRRHGFAVLHDCIPKSAIPAIAAALHPDAAGPGAAHAACTAATALPEGHPDRSRSQISYIPLFAQHVAHPALLEAARAVFHDAHVRVAEVEFMGKCLSGKSKAAAGGRTHRGYHSDWPHDPGSGGHVGAVSQPAPDVCMSLSTVWYLTDVDAESGGTWAVPCSSRDRRNPRGPDDCLDDSAPFLTELQVSAPAGSVFIQDSRNWHSTPHNPSEDARLAVVVRYCPSWMSVEHGLGETGYAGANTAWVPRQSWLQMPPPVRELFRHRAEGVIDALQPVKTDGRRHRQSERPHDEDLVVPLTTAAAAAAAAAAEHDSGAAAAAAEAPVPLDGSPFLQAELAERGLLEATFAACALFKRRGYCVVQAGAADSPACAAARGEWARLPAELCVSLPPPDGDGGCDCTAALLAATPHATALLGQPAVAGTAKALLDSHIKVASVSTLTRGRGVRGGGGWRCSFPHLAGHRGSWVEAPFPSARMGLVVMQCFDDGSGAVAVEVLEGSHRRLRAPVPADECDASDGVHTVTLTPGQVLLIDSRSWWRAAPVGGQAQGQESEGQPVGLQTVIVPWWISLEFPRTTESLLRGWGGTPLPRAAFDALPSEAAQQLVQHMVVGEQHQWQPSKIDETNRAHVYGARPARRGNRGIVPGAAAAAAAVAAAGRHTRAAAVAAESDGYSPTGSGTMKVVLVRHAQSTNTEVASALLGAADDFASQAALERGWLAQREVDPRLTPQGQAEAARLCQFFDRNYLSSVLDLDDVTGSGEAPDRVRLAVRSSPMWRAMQTAAPLAAALRVERLAVDPALAELGGHFGGAAPSAEELVEAFGQSGDEADIDVAIDVARLPANDDNIGHVPATGWDADAGFEGWAEVRQRSSLLKAVITAFPCVSLPFFAVPLLSQRTVAIRADSGRSEWRRAWPSWRPKGRWTCSCWSATTASSNCSSLHS